MNLIFKVKQEIIGIRTDKSMNKKQQDVYLSVEKDLSKSWTDIVLLF